RTAPPALARAEAAARPAVSHYLASRSSETADTFTFYLRAVLSGLGEEAAATCDQVAPRLAAELRRTVPTQRLWSRVLPGVRLALAALRARGLRLVAVSNSDGTVEEGLQALHLRQELDYVVDSAVIGIEKPDPGIFRHALALAGCRPESTLHVGDLYAVDVL